MKTNNKSQQGQGLLEAVFAIGILLMVAGAILALAVANSSGQKASEFQIRANNLAREGIEVVRSIRDANWLAGIDWDTGLVPNNPGDQAIAEFTYIPDTQASSWQLNFSNSLDPILYLDLSNGVHSHNSNNGQRSRTVFSRVINIDEICLDNNGIESISQGSATCVGQGQEKIGIRVESVVSWSERGRSNQIKLEDLMYAWR